MLEESHIDPCASLREEIRELEARLAEIDSNLGPQLVEVPENAPEPEIPFRKVEFREDEGNDSDVSENRTLRWVGLLVLTASVAGLWLIVVAPMLRAEQPTAMKDRSLLRVELERDFVQAEQALRSFYKADSIHEILKWVRQPDALEPVIRAHYLRELINPCEVEIDPPQRVHQGNETFVLTVVRLPHVDEGREVAVSIGESGARVDWELAMNSQETAWRTFSASSLHASPSTFRVKIDRSDYYNANFDEDEWLSFRITAPGTPEALYGFAPRGPMGKQLLTALGASRPEPARVILSVMVADRVENEPLLRIVSVVQDQWLVANQDLPLQPIKNHSLAVRKAAADEY